MLKHVAVAVENSEREAEMVWQSMYHAEHNLPEWMEKTQLQWVMWIYALWQIVRTNVIVLFALSVVPFSIKQLWNKRDVIVLEEYGDTQNYDTTVAAMEEYFKEKPPETFKLVRKFHPSGYWWYVQYKRYTYLTHQNTLVELADCWKKIGHEKNMIYVEHLVSISGSIGVGRQMSEKEAYEKIWSKRWHPRVPKRLVVPTKINYVDLSSKLWGVLSTVPILLQARHFNRISNLISLVIILSDLKRSWLYKLYDKLFFWMSRFVKLHIFKEKTTLYHLFSIFSVSWIYSDRLRKCSYVTEIGDKVLISHYNKLRSPYDIDIVEWVSNTNEDKLQERMFLSIDRETATYKRMVDTGPNYSLVKLNKRIYVT